jgi:multisubunit Na+/H+ antiporter MnhG subunit
MTNLSTIRSIVVLFAILVTGMLAGVMLGVAMEQQTRTETPRSCVDTPAAK